MTTIGLNTKIDLINYNFMGQPYVVVTFTKTTDQSTNFEGMPYVINDPINFIPIIMIF